VMRRAGGFGTSQLGEAGGGAASPSLAKLRSS